MSASIDAGSAGFAPAVGEGLGDGLAGAVDEAVAPAVALAVAPAVDVGDSPFILAAPDPDGAVAVEVWLSVEHAAARTATSPVIATRRHTRAVVDPRTARRRSLITRVSPAESRTPPPGPKTPPDRDLPTQSVLTASPGGAAGSLTTSQTATTPTTASAAQIATLPDSRG